MSRLKKICALILSVSCVISLCACSKGGGSVSNTAEASLFYDTMAQEVKSGDGTTMNLLHDCFDEIYTSSATSNKFMPKLSDTGEIDYTLNGKSISSEQFHNIENATKILDASEFNAFELLAYASYLDESGNKFGTDLATKSQLKLFEFMKGVYDGSDTEVDFRNALGEARDIFYASLNVESLSHISYDINGDYLHISTNALMPGLFGFGEGENIVGCYETKQGFCQVPYEMEDGSKASMDVHTHTGIIIGSKGTAIGYEYITVGSNKEAVLRDIYYLVGGGCVNGEISEEERPENVLKESTMFYGERSLGSLAEMECYLVFEKMVKDFNVTTASMSYVIAQDIGINLTSSAGVQTGSLLKSIGFDPDDAEVYRSAVGRIPYGDNAEYGDIYGWYELEMPDAGYSNTCMVEGFAVLHNRDYGFSAENYVRIF